MKHDTHSRYNAPAVLAHLATLGWDMDPNNSGLLPSFRYYDHLRNSKYPYLRNSKYPSMYIRGIRSVRGYTELDVARFVIACDHKDARRESAIRSHMIDVRLGTWEAKITRAVSSIAMSLYALSNKHMERDMKEAAAIQNRKVSLAKALAPHGISEADFRKVFDPSYDYTNGNLISVRTFSKAIPLDGNGLTQETVDLYHHFHSWMNWMNTIHMHDNLE